MDTLLENGLIDELILMVFPVVLGKGKPLFRDGTGRAPFEVVESRPAGEVVILRLAPATTD
jgi:dihydrofolate reductase